MTALAVTGVCKAFGARTILKDITLTVVSGSLLAVLGPSGSGKTTLLRLICGFERTDRGTIRLGDTLVSGLGVHVPAERRHIGYVAQDGALFPHLSVADNIAFGLPRRERRRHHRVAELLELVGLSQAYAHRPPQELSGGEQQRVALARALAPGPKLLLLDEPFSALDAGLRAETREAVASAIRAAGATAILVTHDQDEALSMGQRVGVLQNGRLAQISAPEALYRQPASPELANFVGAAVFFPGQASGEKVLCALGELNLAGPAIHGPVEVMVRPEQIKVTTEPAPGSVHAVINHVTFYGHDAVLRLAIVGAEPGDVTARIFSQCIPKPGSFVWLAVEGDVVAYAEPVSA
jgi:iron(III) transport system ATP-binding protein